MTKYIKMPTKRRTSVLAEMYAGRVACCLLVSHGEYDDGTDRRTDARPLHYTFH